MEVSLLPKTPKRQSDPKKGTQLGIVTINTRRTGNEHRAFLHNGMKPLFLLGAIHSVISMMYWTVAYPWHLFPFSAGILPSQLHAHEFVYGFSFAIVGGFLLAALPYWTDLPTISGKKLGCLVVLWLIPRIVLPFGSSALWIAAASDMLFCVALLGAVAHPIITARRWRQGGILGKVALLSSGSLCFYLGEFHILPQGVYVSTYGGLYTIVSLILAIGGRVLPGFIQNGLNRDAPLTNPRWIAPTTMILLVTFFLLELLKPDTDAARLLASCLATITAMRLYRWHDRGIWRHPLLWGLYLSLVNIALGFFLFSITPLIGASKTLVLHTFTIGGIGMATISMMVRAALGHYGGDVRNPPQRTSFALISLCISELFRVPLPLLFPSSYGMLIAFSQLAWIVAYGTLTTILVGVFWPSQGRSTKLSLMKQ